MTDSEYPKFKALLERVSDFYSKEVSEFTLDVWWSSMKPFDLPAVQQAFNRHVVNPDGGEFMPKPASIVKMLQGSTQDSALVAWSKVDKAIRSIGTYSSIVFDDALIHRVIDDMGGWIFLGTKEEKEWPFIAKDFETRYRGYKMRSETPSYPPVLTGIAESNNARHGFAIQPPVLVGDHAKAQLVLSNGVNKPSIEFHRGGNTLKLVGKNRSVA